MIRINLLPHREEKRKARQKQFAILAGFAAAIGLAVAGLLWVVFDAQVENQKSRNKYLNEEIAKLDKQIDEIKRIREETASWTNLLRVRLPNLANRDAGVSSAVRGSWRWRSL